MSWCAIIIKRSNHLSWV